MPHARTVLRTAVLFSLALLAASCSSSYYGERSTSAVVHLQSAIDSIVTDSLFVPARAALEVVSLRTGEVLYDRDSRLLFHPASNMKLITTAAALKTLGKNFSVHTSVYGTLSADGTVTGDLVIAGRGDPDLTMGDLESLADTLLARGVRRIAGDLVADVAYFDSLWWGYCWMYDDDPASYQPFLTPLSVEKNCVEVVVTPASRPGAPPTVELVPKTSFLAILNTARTVSPTDTETVYADRLWRERLNVITVRGDIRTTSKPQRYHLNVWDPGRYAALLFLDALKSRGIDLEGSVRLSHRAASMPPLLADHAHGLDSLMVNLNKVSDNLSAENLLRIVAAQTLATTGSAEAGIWVAHRVLQSFGVDSTSYAMVDGSGLSHCNLVYPELYIRLLTAMFRDTVNFPLFYASLPIAGVDGTISSRMKGTPAENNVHAKTGSINGVSTLSGYVRTSDGEPLAFSMMMQNFITATRAYRLAQDRICELLARFSRGGVAGR